MTPTFEWNQAKAAGNVRKHGVRFEEARTVFEDEEALLIPDPIHSVGDPMKTRYDFSDGTKNPYAKRLKRSVTIRLDASTVDYFKGLAAEMELPYQSLINLYLRDCAASGRRLSMRWQSTKSRAG